MHAAVEAMRTELGNVHINGRIVIGEGERDEAPMLWIGEEVGGGDGPEVDIAVDPLEGTTLCAKNQPDSICVLAMAERGGLLNAPDVYMQKIAIGAGYPDGTGRSRREPTREHHVAGQGQGRAGRRDHRLHARPAPPRRRCSTSCAPPAAPSS